MTGKILVSTAYLPPVEYFSVISQAEEVIIEKEENYLKQSYRNRCYILSSHGSQLLTIPVYLGSQHKTPIKEIRIDYTKRWQQVHIGAIIASYGSSPYFQFYFEQIEKIISKKTNFLFDLNIELTESVLKMLKLDTKLMYTKDFVPVGQSENDFRYKISPKKESHYSAKEYLQVFDYGNRFRQKLSIIDLIFNMGPEAGEYF
jgi:hypothetical protein